MGEFNRLAPTMGSNPPLRAEPTATGACTRIARNSMGIPVALGKSQLGSTRLIDNLEF